LVCEAIRPHAIKNGKPAMIDVHLMIEPVDRIVPDFAKAGANLISFHPEASTHVHRTLSLIKDNDCQAGLVLNPASPIHLLDHALDQIDLVLLMSVNPGGIKIDNIGAIAKAGADTFVAGSAIFGKPNYRDVIEAMRKEIASSI